MTELVFLVEGAPDGGYTARALSESILTEADTWEGLEEAVKEAVLCHFGEERHGPRPVQLRHLQHAEGPA